MLEHAYGYDDVAIVPGEFTINPELAETKFKIQELELDNNNKYVAISALTEKNFDALKEIIKKNIDMDKRIINKNYGVE